MPTLTDRLKKIAGDLGSQAQLARAARVSRSAVTQWFQDGVDELKSETVLNIEESTGYSARWIVFGKGPKKLSERAGVTQQQAQIHPQLSPEHESKFLTVLRAFLEADDEGKNEIAEAVAAIATSHESASGRRDKSNAGKRRRGGADS